MAESKPPTGTDPSASQKVFNKVRDGDSPSPNKSPSALNRNPSQRAEQTSPLQKTKDEANASQKKAGDSVTRSKSKKGSEQGSNSPMKRSTDGKGAMGG